MVKPLLVLTALLQVNTALGQNAPASTNIPVILPPSPETAALEKYVKNPVNGYTGTLGESINLYTIKERDLTIPITLNYHAGGFRVGEEASWVGLGWTLNAGGVISRSIRAVDDFLGWLQPNNPPMLDCIGLNYGDTYAPGNAIGPNNAFSSGDRYTGAFAYQTTKFSREYVGGKINENVFFDQANCDWEPDNFSYSFGGRSGEFVFNNQKAITLIQKEKIKFTYASSGTSWKAITPDGFQYYFEDSGTTQFDPVTAYNSGITEWYLTKVRSPLGEEITFTYAAGSQYVFSQPTLSQVETKNVTGTASGEPLNTTGLSTTRSTHKYLARIDFKSGYLLFECNSSSRLDLDGAESLKAIKVFATDGSIVKTINFATSYFDSPRELSPNTFASQSNTYQYKRLRLDNIQEQASTGEVKPATSFTYNATALPAKTSYDVDYWGYYNGAKFNTSLIPSYSGTVYGFSDYGTFSGADREPDATGMKACVLEKITYPTGGSTSFSFEPNQYSNLNGDEQYVAAGTQAVSVYRDDARPYYNSPPQTFTLVNPRPASSTSGITQVHVNFAFTDNIPNDSDGKSRTYITLTGPNGYVKNWGFSSYGTYDNSNTRLQVNEYVALAPGSYQVTLSTPGNSLQGIQTPTGPAQISIQGDLTWPQYQRQYSKLAGGLRIAKVVDYDGVNPQNNQVRSYEYPNSGVLITHPRFARTIKIWSDCGSYYSTRFQLCSFSSAYLSTEAQGSLVGYSKIITYTDQAKKTGKVEQTYYSQEAREPTYSERNPSVPVRRNLLNGSLLGESTYAGETGSFALVKAAEYSYDTIQTKDVGAIFRGAAYANVGFDNGSCPYQEMCYYPIATGWVRLRNKITSTYSTQGIFTEKTAYYYDTSNVGHMQLSRTETNRSDGSTLVTTTTYPADYTAVTTGPLAAMRSDAVYQHGAVVESITQTYSQAETLTQARTLAGSYTEYAQPNNGSGYLPSAQHALDLTQPTSAFGTAVPSLPPSGRYAPKLQLSYDPVSAGLQQAQRPFGIPTSYLWGYRNSLPLASIQNASFSQVEAALAAMGTSVTALATITDESQLRSTFAQLRQRLPQARITSLTYQPLIGVSSQTKPDGRLLRYEYDGFQRLLRVRDEQGRILSQQEYKFGL
jgi:YD repeat-containing protein